MGQRGQLVPEGTSVSLHRRAMRDLPARFALLLLVACPLTAAAQSPTQKEPDPPVTPPAVSEPAAVAPETPSDAAPTGPSGALFVSRIELRGNPRLPQADIDALIAGYQNREVSAEELQTLRSALTKLYVDHGYVNSVVALPDQNVEDGVVVLQAIEGRLERVSVEGKTHLSQRYVSGRVLAHISSPL